MDQEHSHSHLQIRHTQGVHVQTDDITWSGETVVRVKLMAEFWLGEELLLRNRSEIHTHAQNHCNQLDQRSHPPKPL